MWHMFVQVEVKVRYTAGATQWLRRLGLHAANKQIQAQARATVAQAMQRAPWWQGWLSKSIMKFFDNGRCDKVLYSCARQRRGWASFPTAAAGTVPAGHQIQASASSRRQCTAEPPCVQRCVVANGMYRHTSKQYVHTRVALPRLALLILHQILPDGGLVWVQLIICT